MFQLCGHSAVLDVCAVDAPFGHLLVLTDDGALHGIDMDTNRSARLSTVTLPALAEDGNNHFGKPRHRLHACADGRYAAVVVDQGQHGIVVETRSGKTPVSFEPDASRQIRLAR
jgi:hypothetical protein